MPENKYRELFALKRKKILGFKTNSAECVLFNSDETMKAFELETVGAAQIRNNILTGSELISATSFAVFENASGLDDFFQNHIGRKICF